MAGRLVLTGDVNLMNVTDAEVPFRRRAMAEIKVCVYPTAKSVLLHIGTVRGYFERFGVTVSVHFTENSRTQRDSLASGASDVLHLAVDNAVSMADDDGHDVVIVSGGDDGMNDLFVQPGIADVSGLRGKRLVVDARDTAFALQAIKILRNHGLEPDRDYCVDAVGRGELRLKAMAASADAAVAVLNPPYSFAAEDMGLKSLGNTVDLLGPYQASGAFVMRPWANANRETLERYLAGYILSLRWLLDRRNEDRCVAMMCEKLGLSPSIAARSYAALIDGRHGLARDAVFDAVGFENTLALRMETMKAGAGRPRAAEDYVDLSFHAAALKLANAAHG